MGAQTGASTSGAADFFETFSRFGFAARGVVYVIIGFFAIYGGQAGSFTEALSFIGEQAFGRILVGLVGVGLFAYGVWRLVGAWFDLEDEGDDAKGLVKRGGHVASGVTNTMFAGFGLAIAFGVALSSGGGGETAAGLALDAPGGRFLLMAVGAGLILAGVCQAFKAFTGAHMEHVAASGSERKALKWVGRAGYAARAVVFVLLGWFVFEAGRAAQANLVQNPGEVMSGLSGWPSLAVAAGFLLFGVFSFMMAWYRRINDDDLRARLDRLEA